jgi:hypothetical protein
MADDFATLLVAVRRVFPASLFEPVSEPELTAIRTRFPGIPEHYLEFLRHVGCGSLGDGNFLLYGGPCEPGELFDAHTAAGLDGVVFLGDNFAGWLIGFDTNDGWRLVGVDSASPAPCPEEARTVAEFIAERVADQDRN